MENIFFENFGLEDFASNESFINYHLRLNEKDILFWQEWIIKNPGKKGLLNEAACLIDILSLRLSEKEYHEEFEKIIASINNEPKISQYHPGKMEFAARKKRVKIVLAFVLCFIIAGGIYGILRFSNTRQPALTDTANNTNKELIITLSDSSVVSLAPHSHLKYPLHFDEAERNVYLSGDAQFSIKRDVQHPFKVHAENIIATVLGTVFNIRNSGDSAVVVELLKGKLNVEIMNTQFQAEQSVLLIPNERAIYVRENKHLYKNLISPENHFYFRKSSFATIASQLKQAFGIEILNESENKNWKFTGEFKNVDAKEIIENICLIKNLSFVVKGDTIVIK